MAEIGTGSTIWVRSQYRSAAPQECKIIDESKLSWIFALNTWEDAVKFPKKADTEGERWTAIQRRGRRYQVFVTVEEVIECERRRQAAIESGVWLSKHRYAIQSAVSRCDKVDILRQVAALVGYTPEEPAMPIRATQTEDQPAKACQKGSL